MKHRFGYNIFGHAKCQACGYETFKPFTDDDGCVGSAKPAEKPKLTPGSHKFDLWSDGTMTLHAGVVRLDVEIDVDAGVVRLDVEIDVDAKPADAEKPYYGPKWMKCIGGTEPLWLKNRNGHGFFGETHCSFCGLAGSTFLTTGRPQCISTVDKIIRQLSATSPFAKYLGKPKPAPDYDAIILAARRRRTNNRNILPTERDSPKELLRRAKNVAKEAKSREQGTHLETALSQPLDFSVAAYKGPVLNAEAKGQ